MKNIDLVKALHGIWNTGDLGLIDSVYARDFLGVSTEHLRKVLKI